MARLELHDVCKRFGDVEVNRNVDLTFEDGEFIVLVGPSGCGKTTLLRMIAGLEQVTSGRIVIDGQDVTSLDAPKRGLAMVFQSYALYPHMTVRQNMAFGLENIAMPRAEIDSRIADVAAMLRLQDYLERRPAQLSGGQRQRVAIGRAITRDPKAFLFDEPLSNLDAELRVTMRKELAKLHKRIGGTMIYVTHDQTEAMTLADRIVVLEKGIVSQVGTPLDLYFKPNNRFVAGFIGSPQMNFLDIGIEGGRARIGAGAVIERISAHDGPAILGVRPEHVAPAANEAGDLEVTIDLVEQLGDESFVYCRAEGLPELCMRLDGAAGACYGDRMSIRFDRSNMHLFDPVSGAAIAPG
ncbi:MAG: sn-glycerol-3-phosphate ABC transporter ATP-binding protein UgpC [Roseitalea sp.]|jgi:ABC-type sugar transport system ATPase subunit|nr:sn-glycerol-3-phosphate ABC transporter ATP-binding protein UgpC [Roseitalea sp.]MBO6720993.1 sn-glycerol-3-phosphate ABC transporter ATP-binding protein UgpC [Roseitalea sp.]MBO6742935.1 sn-glycerol-3-phosphate ABC transporter ATP-binding protein UgpC [Roseitalea sp.]